MLLALATLWGGSFFFQRVALDDLPPLTLVALRVLVATLALAAVLRFELPRQARLWATFLGMGLLNNAIPFTLIVWGQQHVASGLASILNATTPLFTVLVAHGLTRDEKLTRAKAVGVALGLLGAIAMIGPAALDGLGTALAAQVAILVAALSYAFAAIYGRRFRRMGVPPLAAAFGQVASAATLLLPLALLVDQPWTLPEPSAPTLGAVLALGLLCTALAYILYFRILAAAGATNLLLVTFLVPVTAILLGVLVLDEPLLTRQLLGMALIGAGLAAIDGRLFRRAA
jgi:drug/metabolite transporter (DMT)-like permease